MINTNDQLAEVALERVRHTITHRIEMTYPYMTNRLEFIARVDAAINCLELGIKSMFLQEKQKPVVINTIPTTWWQMLKQAHAPQWFIRLFPIQYKTITIDAQVLYPSLKISIPSSMSHAIIRFAKIS